MHDSKYQCHMAASCTYHQQTNFSYLLNKSHIKKPISQKNGKKKFWGGKVRRMGSKQKKGQNRKSNRSR